MGTILFLERLMECLFFLVAHFLSTGVGLICFIVKAERFKCTLELLKFWEDFLFPISLLHFKVSRRDILLALNKWESSLVFFVELLLILDSSSRTESLLFLFKRLLIVRLNMLLKLSCFLLLECLWNGLGVLSSLSLWIFSAGSLWFLIILSLRVLVRYDSLPSSFWERSKAIV